MKKKIYKEIQLFTGSDKPRMLFFLLIYVKVPTSFGISRKNFMLRRAEHEQIFITSRPGTLALKKIKHMTFFTTRETSLKANLQFMFIFMASATKCPFVNYLASIVYLLKVNGYISKGSNSTIFFSAFSLNKSQLLKETMCPSESNSFSLTLLHSEQPKLYGVLAILSAIGFRVDPFWKGFMSQGSK